jgi:glycoprotein-N-acetylgalactosamine 3-beta-galactosyltransferase
MVASTKTDASLGTVDIPHEGPEAYNNMWQKVRSIWTYVYNHYYDMYDWFHIGGDDLFLIVENLRDYLESEEIRTAANGGIYLPDDDRLQEQQTPLYLGYKISMRGKRSDVFNSGGSGYTLNKAALKALVVEGFPNFYKHDRTSEEDVRVGRILRKLGIHPYKTKDENGGERYIPLMPASAYKLPTWVVRQSFNIKHGPEWISPKTISFHYVKGEAMRRLYGLLYRHCP